MKKLIISSAMLLFAGSLLAQIKMPQPSPKQTITQDFGQGEIEIVYSRPSVKGRTIFGDVVPYGALWRTGANAATRITFTEPVIIEGKKIDTGSYAIYTIPGKDVWEVIINKGYKNSGIVGYKESDDVVKMKLHSKKLLQKAENFTIQIDNVTTTSCSINLMWDNTSVSFQVMADYKDKLRSEIETALQSDKKPFWLAAQFYREFDLNNQKALENINSALAESPNAFWMWLYKARIQKDMGDKTGAAASSKKSLEIATTENNQDYIKMNNDFLKSLK